MCAHHTCLLYTSRDPMNSIHWAATAKEQKLMVRNYEYTSQQSLTILLNIKSQEIEYGDVYKRQLLELPLQGQGLSAR